MAYVDGFVIAVPKANVEKYKQIAKACSAIWLEHGAISYVECLADDTPYGEITSFPRAVMATEDEIVVFSWITYKSRAERDEANKMIMEDPRLQNEDWKGVFDAKRMIYGGFESFVEV